MKIASFITFDNSSVKELWLFTIASVAEM